MKKTINVWMQLLGFDREEKDRGVSRFLENTGFVPDSVTALLFHPDFIHLHRGMDEEYELFPDNCSYRAVLRNTERERQRWTNYELRDLIRRLRERGVDFYVSIMGAYVRDRFHKEWLTDHQELRASRTDSPGNLMCLKRFSDGSYYEDFFVGCLTRTLVDYECAGIHLADMFCPSEHLYVSDYSTDMTEQFVLHTGMDLPANIKKTLGDDSTPAVRERRDYIWSELRSEWIAFYEWRWESFFKKVADAVHSVGKKVWVLGMYCSDPFETRYVYGFDTKRVMDAGVDAITANILPTSVYYEQPTFPYYFHRIHMDLPLLRAQLGEGNILSMLGIHDAAEEWSMIDHAPVRVERDAYTMTAFSGVNADGARPAADGVFICLGDGVDRHRWSFIKERLDLGFDGRAGQSVSPMILWSDTAHGAMLREYLATKRTTPHKQSFEIFKAGTPLGGAVRSEYIGDLETVLFVPNYDMLSEKERESLAEYKHPWVATMPEKCDTPPTNSSFSFTDPSSDYPMRAFVCNLELSESERAEIAARLAVYDHTPSRRCEPECDVHPPIAELPFAKLSRGFVSAVAYLLDAARYRVYPVRCNYPMLILKLRDGGERIYIYNSYDSAYVTAVVDSEHGITDATVASAYPVLPVKFITEEDKSGMFDYSRAAADRKRFQVRLAPDGVTVVDIRRETNL